MAAATYSVNIGTTEESTTSNSINSVLSLLPNNTQKLISPRDARDAIFSSWENSVFRYTDNGGTGSYIGIARSNIKDKIFFGKKELSGTSILNNTLLSNNSDIFFYNTKSDSNPSQDLKISFLAGDPVADSSIFNSGPFISVTKVTSGTPSFSFNISHSQTFGGDINLLAGDNGRISLNEYLILPSSNEIQTKVLSPAASSASDLFLVRTSSGYIEFRTGASLTSIIGVTGSPTYIFGSPVYLNGYSLEFTDSTPTGTAFGGIPIGSTFSSVPLSEMIRMMLYPDLGPLSTITLSSTVLERNHNAVTNVPYIYSISKRSYDVTSSISIKGSSTYTQAGPSIIGGGYTTNNYSDSYTFSTISVSSNTPGVFTFSVSLTDTNGATYVVNENLSFVYPYFYGFSATTSNVQNIVFSDLTKLVDTYDDQVVNLAGTEEYLYYCFPANYGDLQKIYDSNGFLLWQFGTSSTSWTYSQVALTSVSNGWAATYLVYRTTSIITVPPTQDYQFNFTI